jgi:hypothetical protein
MNQYRATSPAGVTWFGDDVFEAEFSVDEESEYLARGFIEIVPRPYRTLTDRYTVDGVSIAVDEVVELAMPIGLEAALVGAGHLVRVRRDAHPTVEPEPEPEPKQARRRRTATPIKE